MAFADIAAKDGLARVIRCDISLDGFATVAYRYADRAGSYDGSAQWSSRIPLNGGLSSVRRGFGTNRVAASGTTTLTLNNADGAVDWLCGRAGISDAAKARFRLYVGYYVPGAAAPAYTDIQWRMLGEFICAEWPRQNNSTVQVQLADDFLGRLSGVQLPTFEDWQAVGTSANNPFKNGIGLPASLDVKTPIQLAFGEDYCLALPHCIAYGNSGTGDTYAGKVIVPICTTADLSAVSQDLVESVQVEWVRPPLSFDDAPTETATFSLPRYVAGDSYSAPLSVWSVEKSPTITKGGKSFQVVYLVVAAHLGDLRPGVPPSGVFDSVTARNWQLYTEQLAYQGGYPRDAVDSVAIISTTTQDGYKNRAARVVRWYVRGKLSAYTNPPGTLLIEHSVDALVDLASVYGSATVDATSAARTKAAVPLAACSGVVQPWTELANRPATGDPLPVSLRQSITALAQSADVDVFCNWSGNVAFSTDLYDYTVATGTSGLVEFQETEVELERWVPSAGERGAAFNRVVFDGGRADPALKRPAPFQGPFDYADADIPIASRVVEVSVPQGWRPWRQQATNPAAWRNLDSRARDRIRVRTHRGAMRLELGDLFKVTWTRGSSIGGPYTSSIFQLDSLTYLPGDDSVELEAVWRDDVATEKSYLLDNESLLVRSKSGLSGNATFSGTATVGFDGTIDLIALGVQAGDVLVLRSSAEAATSFTFNAAYRITSVPASYYLVVTGPSGSPALSGANVPNAEWSIVRGATTYPTAVSDPTNYPDGSTMYGKVTTSAGLDSSGGPGNRLLNG